MVTPLTGRAAVWWGLRFVDAEAVRLGLAAALAVLLVGCGSSSGGSSQASPTPSTQPPLACTSSGAATSGWPSPESRTGTAPPIVSAVVAGDTLTLTFDQGTPGFEVKTQEGSHFIQDPSGKSVDLAGSAGVTITLRGFRGDMRNYSGPASMMSSGPRLLQVYELGDYEGVVTWAAGLGSSGCANVTASGSVLTIQFVASAA
jgi:hypothetical protein